jgi:hypothetical protein
MVADGLRPSQQRATQAARPEPFRYIANSEYWPVVLVMSLVLIVIAALPSGPGLQPHQRAVRLTRGQ